MDDLKVYCDTIGEIPLLTAINCRRGNGVS